VRWSLSRSVAVLAIAGWLIWRPFARSTVRRPMGEKADGSLAVDLSLVAERKLMQSERLAVIGETLFGVAHESRNALQQIQACCMLLRQHRRGDDASEELLSELDQAQRRLQRLFDDLHAYAAPMKLDRKRWDVSQILDESWAGLEPYRTGRDAVLEQHGAGLDTCCLADLLGLKRVFRNILENALAACNDPVWIDVQFAHVTHKGKEMLEVIIRDNGPGLNDEQRARIFEPFYTTKSSGSGLGMTIARRIIEAHSGWIGVGHSASGAEILLALPRSVPSLLDERIR
jgi:two-component system, LuxR family, sensor kinase FixL